ncbi:MAG: hypothetical protein KatS3mg103_0813 [Phycisphaerales bacterium]|nr:MAG: hypothetical protein KatS3mg103_0813 [Phycisphaerales bacterium]
MMLAGLVLMLALLALKERLMPGQGDAFEPANPIMEMIRTLDPVLLVVLLLTGTIWAPLCEEMIFRGGAVPPPARPAGPACGRPLPARWSSG